MTIIWRFQKKVNKIAGEPFSLAHKHGFMEFLWYE